MGCRWLDTKVQTVHVSYGQDHGGHSNPVPNSKGRPKFALICWEKFPKLSSVYDSGVELAMGNAKSSPDPAARLDAIVEFSEDAIVSKNLNGIILTWNKSAERMYGYSPSDVIGKPISILLPDDRSNEEAQILDRLRHGERVQHFETTRIRKDGKIIHVSLAISPIFGEDGQILGASHVARDITERKQFEEQLRQTQRLESLGVLAGGIAHDFNNLLTGVLGNASLATELLPAGSAVQPFLRDITKATQRLSDLTRQLLAYSGKGTIALAPVNISELVQEISALIQSSIPKAVQVRLQLDEHVPPVHADPSQLQQVIMNLIINGAEAVPTDEIGSVTVSTSSQLVDEPYISTVFSPGEIHAGQYVCLEVHDTGKGIDLENLSRIFDPFFTTKTKGRGLGLAAVLGIVQSHKGAIKVYSQSGKGSTFKILLPALIQTEPARLSSMREDLRGSATVLVVDDEEVIRRVAKAALELYGYRVVLAEDGEQGVELYERMSQEIQVIVLDWMMPRMNGEEAFRRLRLIRPDVRVILTSGYSDSEAMSKFAGKDLAGFLKKPYSAVGLGEMVKRALTDNSAL